MWTVGEHKIKGRVLDLSEQGAKLFTRHALEVGQDFKLCIAIDGIGEIAAPAFVRWLKKVPEKDGYATGVSFSNLEVPDFLRIKKFLERLDGTLGM